MKTRQIILDTETTGLYPEKGDRIVQIACMEIISDKMTDNYYQTYINPERDSHPEALKVHGLTAAFLADKPKFADIVDDFLKFVSGAKLIIHNAPFDVGFINRELNLIDRKPLETYCNQIIDTRVIALTLYTKEFLTTELISKKLVEDEILVKEHRIKLDSDEVIIADLIKNPNFRVNSLDHLCKYYDVSLSKREAKHDALVDCELLSQVYFGLKKEQRKKTKSTLLNAPISFIKNVSIFQSDQAQESLNKVIDNKSQNLIK